tara:strand:+ start:4958 stop:5437 length:480 start_codon:yes stop_codon:yes gene_type:complete
MVVSSNVLNLSEQTAGRFRCTFNYVLDDGREINIKPSMVNADYQAVCDARATSVFESVVKSDAKKAFSLGIKDAYGYATQAQVFYEFLDAGYRDPDPVTSYEKMDGIAQQLLSMELTTEQLAGMLGETVEMAQLVIDHWLLLEANKAAIDAYGLIRGQL